MRRIPMSVAALLFAACLSECAFLADRAWAYAPEKAAFAVKVRGEVNPYRTLGVYVLPGETLEVEALSAPGDVFRFQARGGKVVEARPRKLRWTAPAGHGLVMITVERLPRGVELAPNAEPATQGDVMELAVFVMIPYRELTSQSLNGYRIGSYPSAPLRGLEIYRPPRGFIEVTPEVLSVPVSPHFVLGQFVCKQAGNYPKYVVLRERLLLKLEYVLELINSNGYKTDTLAVLSGYRTPFYNEAIGNVKYSRHVWGGAADVFIDVSPQDGMMDDLDKNGVVDVRDADLLYQLLDAELGKKEYEPFVGGLGLYGKTAAHGPFIHVDARGFRARWGR